MGTRVTISSPKLESKSSLNRSTTADSPPEITKLFTRASVTTVLSSDVGIGKPASVNSLA
jgi:hypothetical protein